MSLSKTYSLEENPPVALTWDDYSHRVMEEWRALLDGEQAYPESVFQAFLERHPCMLPGPFGFIHESGHCPFPDSVISQPSLKGVGHKIPDFMWLGNDSLTFYPTLIEIEAPSKKWFDKKGVPTKDFIQAQDQLSGWRAWFKKTCNVDLFFELFRIPDEYRRDITIEPQFVLIYGRRSEFLERPELNAKRHALQRDNEVLMTYDRLSPRYDARNFWTVKLTNNGYEAKNVMPVLQLSPWMARTYPTIKNKHEAIGRIEWISEERRSFLLRRIDYWENWRSRGSCGIIDGRDKE